MVSVGEEADVRVTGSSEAYCGLRRPGIAALCPDVTGSGPIGSMFHRLAGRSPMARALKAVEEEGFLDDWTRDRVQGALGGARRRRRRGRAAVAATVPGERRVPASSASRPAGPRWRRSIAGISMSCFSIVAGRRGGAGPPAGNAAASGGSRRHRRDGVRVDRKRGRCGQARRGRLHSEALHARSDPVDRESCGRGAAPQAAVSASCSRSSTKAESRRSSSPTAGRFDSSSRSPDARPRRTRSC